MTNDHSQIRPVILSGSSGTRLWPLSREEKPKQFLRLLGDKTMLQETLQRVLGEPDFDAPMIIASGAHQKEIESQLSELNISAEIVLEPIARNTAPAIALAALSSVEDQALLIMPSDHSIADVAAFRQAVRSALPAVEKGALVTFGITPTAPETGYGYIKQGQQIADACYVVDAFVEKPDIVTAERYLESGSYFWNGGIFMFTARAALQALQEHAPDVLSAATASLKGAERQGFCISPQLSAFRRSPSISIDYAVMEKASQVVVVPLDAGWSDIGSWDALYGFADKDEFRNVVEGDVIQIGSDGCFIRTEGPLVAAMGVENLIIIATADAVLVLPRGESQRVKEAISLLQHRSESDPIAYL